jgi:hypothetical protein
LAERLLMRADTLADHGFYDEAIVVAWAAAEAAEPRRRHEPSNRSDSTDSSSESDLRSAAAAAIERARRGSIPRLRDRAAGSDPRSATPHPTER